MLYHFYFKLNNPLKEATTFRYGLCDLFISENCHPFLKVIYIEPFVMIKVDSFILISLSIKGFHNKTIMFIILALTFVYLLTIFVYLFIKGCKENIDNLQHSPKFAKGFFCWITVGGGWRYFTRIWRILLDTTAISPMERRLPGPLNNILSFLN